MAIRRKLSRPSSDELPPAKLYLDDVREITEVLKESVSDGVGDDFLKYRVRNLECDDIAELEKLAGRTRKLEIEVGKGDRFSYIRITPSSTLLWLGCSGNNYLASQSRIKAIFDGNVIRWKQLLKEIGELCSLIPAWVIGLVILGTVLISLLAPSSSGHVRINWEGQLVAGIFMAIYVFGFSGSIVMLRYSYAGGVRKWFQEHGNQLFFVVLGVALSYLLNWLLQHWRVHHP